MRIIGCDLHARQQTLAILDTVSGEVVNRTLMHEGQEVREFYANLPRPVLVGIEAIGPLQRFLNLLEELGIECQVGDTTTRGILLRRSPVREIRLRERGSRGTAPCPHAVGMFIAVTDALNRTTIKRVVRNLLSRLNFLRPALNHRNTAIEDSFRLGHALARTCPSSPVS
jgi:hypothetical protein